MADYVPTSNFVRIVPSNQTNSIAKP